MEKLFDIFVDITGGERVCGKERDAAIVTFCGHAEGKYFVGEIIGAAADTQLFSKDGKMTLSARYILEGKDIDGKNCRIFIENNGSLETGFHPVIITDSEALSFLEKETLSAALADREKGVTVSVYR